MEASYLERKACCEELRLVDAKIKRWRKDRVFGETLERWFRKEAGLTKEQIAQAKFKKRRK